MEITKELLQSYRSKKDEIVELDWWLHNRWKDESLICTDVILDYKTGYPRPKNITGFNYPKYDNAQKKDHERKCILESECEEIERYIDDIPDSLTRRIFRMAFIEGKTQNKIARAVNIDRSYVSKKIDGYIKVSHNSQNSHL